MSRSTRARAAEILREYKRGVVFQLGRFWRVKGPGLVILVPGIQQMVRIAQDGLTRLPGGAGWRNS